ncbi:MAG: glycosyltransferase family 9 protein, partial [Methanococcaceae archaeon]
FDKTDSKAASEFIRSIGSAGYDFLLGIHVGAGKPPNRWPLEKFIQLVHRLNDTFKSRFYFTGSSADKEEIDYIRENLKFEAGYFIDRTIPEVAALAAKSDLFITNDTGIMHVAGATNTPQISIFGPTNPFNWAPVGKEKIFIRKSEFIDDISVDEIFQMCQKILISKSHLLKKA